MTPRNNPPKVNSLKNYRNKSKSNFEKKNGKPDFVLFIITFLLSFFGLVIISSAGIARSMAVYGESYYFLTHQFFYGFLPGLVFWFIFSNTNYQVWRKLAFPMFLISVILLVLVFIPGLGMTVKGAQRWIHIGIFSFQPTEICKLSLIMYLSAWLASNKQNVSGSLKGFLGFIFILGILGGLIMSQPDMGTLGIIVVIACMIYFVSGARFIFLLTILFGGIFSAFALIKMAPYRLQRLTAFLDPSSDPQGIGYQINQSLIALGSGGWDGVGLGHGRQKFNYLPEPVGDSIFAILGEELGLIGCGILIILFLILAWRGFYVARNAPDLFGKLLATGITTWLVFQAFINMAAISALIPLTGVPIPFISYGGSALTFAMAAMGIMLNISKQIKK